MTSRKPNIVFIVLDTLRRDHLSTYGYRRETSPALDAFAAKGTVFRRAIAAAQWTVPSHASMFSGLYPSTHQLTQADGLISGSYPLLAEILRGAGYHTAAFCNNPLVGVLNHGLQRGFERFYNYASAAPFRPGEAQQNRLKRALLRSFRRYLARPLGNQFAHSDFLFRMSLNPAFVPLWTRLINYKGNTANSVNDLLDYWTQHTAGGAERPLFAFLNLMGAHLPYNPPQDTLNRVAPEVRGDRRAYHFMRQFNSEAARWASPPDPALADWEQAALEHFYDAEIAHQDDQLGKLLRHLEQTGALDNTLVIIAADHGEGHGDHDFFGHGFVAYQELVHVPLIIRGTERYPAGKQVDTNVSTRRIFHTVLEAAGLKPPLDEADPNANIEALTLRTVAEGNADSEGDLAFAEAFPPLTFLNVIQHRNAALIDRLNLRGVRRGIYHGSHKLVVIDQRAEGLYDVATDPAETHNLLAEQPEVVSQLQRKLNRQVTLAESRRAEAAAFTPMDDAVLDHLRALGYIE